MRNSTIPVYSLRRQMLRMSWNKYNLYNMTQRSRVANNSNKTLYQQKWASKKDTRSYHGDQITERQWQSMFKTRLPTANTKVGGVEPHPPVFSLTFAEMERRLDFIVFRSNFAPSIYAARQLVGHGKVTVNGKSVSWLEQQEQGEHAPLGIPRANGLDQKKSTGDQGHFNRIDGLLTDYFFYIWNYLVDALSFTPRYGRRYHSRGALIHVDIEAGQGSRRRGG